MAETFPDALRSGSLAAIESYPKSDLHSHAGRGGHPHYIAAWAGVEIRPPVSPFPSLDAMQAWFDQNVKPHCSGPTGYRKRIEAAFAQAQADGITVLCMSFGLGEVDSLGGMKPFTRTIDALRQAFAPRVSFIPALALGRECDVQQTLTRLPEIFSDGWFRSLDLCNNEHAQPIRRFQPIYRLAKSAGLRLTAHVGEFGSADDVWEAVETLELDEVQHGVAAARSPQVLGFLARHHIRCNLCPTSNILLGVADNYVRHPIRVLFEAGVPVTVNTDDLLIFGSSVSEEYRRLYQSGCLPAESLEAVRLTGLSRGAARDY